MLCDLNLCRILALITLQSFLFVHIWAFHLKIVHIFDYTHTGIGAMANVNDIVSSIMHNLKTKSIEKQDQF